MNKSTKDVAFTPVKVDPQRKLFVACIKCGRETNHIVLLGIEERGSDDTDDQNSFQWGVDYEIIQCRGCDTISFRKESSNSEDWDPENGGTFLHEELYPSRTNNRQLIDDSYLLPTSLLRIYQEAVTALNNDQPILSGIGIRAIIETVSNEEKATGHNLAQKIDGLVTKGVLTTDGAKILHKIRALGNEAAHSVKAHAPTELKLAMDVVEHMLEAVYILPHHAKTTFK